MNLKNLHDVYVHELKDIYSAEKQIINALPKMVKSASTDDLQQAFSKHLEQSKRHLELVHGILDKMDVNPGNVKCEGIAGLLKEGEEVVNMSGSGAAKDAALIGAAQRVEHYEMAAYGTARTFARLLGYDDAADTLQKILNEEGDTDKHLTSLAEGGLLSEGINEMAVQS